MQADEYVLNLMTTVGSADRATRYVGGDVAAPLVDVVVVAFKELVPWLMQNEFKLLSRMPDVGVAAMLQPEHGVIATIQEAFGGKVDTNFPSPFPGKVSAVVTIGFADLGTQVPRTSRRRTRNPNARRRPSRPGTFSAWMRSVNGILLREQDVGTWQLSPKQRFEEWFVTGMRPSTAANIIIDGLSTGQIRLKKARRS